MSVNYVSILWNNQKIRYDKGILLFILSYLALFFVLHIVFYPLATFETLLIRAFGILAFFLLHVILAIGPLCRINERFLPLLYNRRHLGVTMFFAALIHGGFSTVQFHALGNMNPIYSLFLSNTAYDSLSEFPFQVLGFFALMILGVMASTSHDFWLKNLGVRIWKSLHMFVYVAYVLIILHVVLGFLQSQPKPIYYMVLLIGLLGIVFLHIITGFKEIKRDAYHALKEKGYLKVCKTNDIQEGRAKIINASGERVAIFKHKDQFYAVNNVCKHQGGPLGEGRIVDGCITCPWHGYQYLPETGESPPPFKEKVSTYSVKIDQDYVWINEKPNNESLLP